MTDWQDIESAPRDGTDILVFEKGVSRIAFWDTARGGIWSEWPGRVQVYPEHWQPTPPPPKVKA